MEIIIIILLCVIGFLSYHIYLTGLHYFPIREIVEAHMKEEGIKTADVHVDVTVRFENVER